jgi:hypothetical protein
MNKKGLWNKYVKIFQESLAYRQGAAYSLRPPVSSLIFPFSSPVFRHLGVDLAKVVGVIKVPALRG